MKKTILCLSMFLFFANSARAFIFSDVAAIAQRATISAQHIIESIKQYTQFTGYIQEFNNYRREFESYHRNFQRVYRRLSSGDYLRDFDVSNWNWTRLDDHILKTWRSYN